MKKIIINKSLLAAVFSVLLFAACTKDENETAKLQSNTDDGELSIQGNAIGSVAISGLISKDAADRMQENFNKKFASSNGTEYVAFSVKDLGNYVQQLKSKYKSDSVYVSFGVYDEKTAVNQKDVGRITVFFFGKNNNPKNSGSIRSQERVDDGTDAGSNYFNHGNIWP
jgi:uncharacterized protein YoxC